MKQRQYQDFVGFRFGAYHSSELGLKVVSSSNRYDKNLLPNPNDYTLDISGGDGQYYFGQTYKNREFTVNIAFDDIEEETWRKISQIFSTDKLQDLVFDELPFKTYKAKIKSAPDFKFICFFDKEKNKRIYKGEGKITFVCYYPYAFGFDKYLVRAADGYYTPHVARPYIPETKPTYKYSYGENKYTIVETVDCYNLVSAPEVSNLRYGVSDNVLTASGQGVSQAIDVAIAAFETCKNRYPNITKIRAKAYSEDYEEFNNQRIVSNQSGYYCYIVIPQQGSQYTDFSSCVFSCDEVAERKYARVWRLGDMRLFSVDISSLTPTSLNRISYSAVEEPFITGEPLPDRQRISGISTEGHLTSGYAPYFIYDPVIDSGLYKNGQDYYTRLLEKKVIEPQNYYHGQKIMQAGSSDYKQRTFLETEHWNVEGNMDTPWKTGFPTKEQVELGELYFNDPVDNTKKLIIDTRAYWDNVPEWQGAAQLLVSPTLDQDGDLIFLPQYSKINYYNMDIGLSNKNGLIGSRLLVYNPGDLPIDFELRMGNLSSSLRRNLEQYTFRISRYNVQRLTIEQAVDWTGLTTYNKEDNEKFKYGDKYFKIIEPQESNLKQENNNIETWNFNPYFRELGCAHPKHTYIVEPIPKEKLSHFIKLFYWQTENFEHTDKFEKAIEMANRYEELYQLCITEEEKYELYWKTLKDLFSEFNNFSLSDYIYNPPEFFISNDLNYGEFDFNKWNYPSYYTYDYFDITNKDFDTIYGGEVNKESNSLEDARREYTLPLFLNSEKHMLYNINKNADHYNFKLTKNIHNDNIIKGHWFKIPPGWSLIDISPIIDADKWGGKRWLDARPFEWGETDEQYRLWYDNVYRVAAVDYLSQHITNKGINIGNELLEQEGLVPVLEPSDWVNTQKLKNYFSTLPLEQLEKFMQFNRWYDYDNVDIYSNNNTVANQTNKNRADWAEINFLKLLANYWHVNKIQNKKPVGDVNDWWWYANNYIWGNFPPLYWGYADLLNHAQIKYVPLFY